MRHSYPRSTFLLIYEKISEKLRDNEPPVTIIKDGKQDTTQLGVKWDQNREPNLVNAASVIWKSVKDYFPEGANFNFGKMLYNKWNEANGEEKKKEIIIQGKEYNEGLFIFLGYKDRTAFETAYGIIPQKADSGTGLPLEEDQFTYYIGVYYSFRSYRVNKFILAIRYEEKNTFPLKAWQWGFHTKESLPLDAMHPAQVNTVRFNGDARVLGRHLYINLGSSASDGMPEMQMHLIGICDEPGGFNLKEQEAIPCSLQAVSLDQYTVSAEAYLLRCTKAEAFHIRESSSAYFSSDIVAGSLTAAQKKSLQLYLMLQRRNFRVKFGSMVSNLDQLEYRGNSISKYTARLEGEYRIWNFGLRRGVVIQSKLVIGKETPYRTLFYPYIDETTKSKNPDLEEQLAVISISNEIRQDQLCFSTFVKRRLTLVSYAIFDLRSLTGTVDWAEGMFVSTGYDRKGVVGGYAVMCKVRPGEIFEPTSMTRDEATVYAEKNGLTNMYTGLRQLWKRKLWKQKSNTDFGVYGVVAHPDKGILMVHKSDGPYAGKYDLPGGKLEFGETPEAGLKRRIKEETGLEIGDSNLVANETDVKQWIRPDGIQENLYHIGAIYKVDYKPGTNAKLYARAVWIQPEQHDEDSFAPFARRAARYGVT
jgi:8-oxo-dGTP diphosphatase